MGTPQDKLNLEGAEPLPGPGLDLSGAEPLPRYARRRPAVAAPAAAPAAPPPAPAPAAPYTGLAPRTKAGVNLEGVAPDLIDFAARRNFTITSGRDSAGVHARGSRHNDGGALDLRTRDKTPEQIRQAVAEAQAAGFHATARPHGTGPHIHLERMAGTLNLDGAEPLNLEGAEPIGEEVGDVVTVNASTALPSPTLPPLPRRQTFDPQTEAGRRGRDERAKLERTPGADLVVAVPLPAEDRLSDAAAGAEMARSAYVRALVARGIPESGAERIVGRDYSLTDAMRKAVAPADAFSDDNIDYKARTMRVKVDAAHISKLVDEYNAGAPAVLRAYKWATDETQSPGEKALDVVTPPLNLAGAVAARGAEGLRRVAKPLDMLSARLWTRLGGGTAEEARAASDAVWNDQPLPAYAENFVAEDIERDMARLNPRVGRAYGALARLLTDPTNFIPAGGVVKLADKFADGVRALRAARTAEKVAAAVADVERVVTEATELAQSARLGAVDVERVAEGLGEVTVRGKGGGRHLINTKTRDVVDLETGELIAEAGASPRVVDTGQHLADYLEELTGKKYEMPGPPRPSLPRRAAGVAGSAADAVKSNLYSADVSVPFRQALFPLMFETRATVRGLGQGLPSALSEGRHAKFVEHMRGLPVAKEADAMGLALASLNPASKSEYFPSAAARRLPHVGASERVMEAQLDAVRLNVYEQLTKDLRAAGLTPASAPEEFRGVAHIVNVASGHGTPGRLLGSQLAPRVLGSPKLLKSRFQVLDPREYARLPPRARRLALRKLGRTAAAFTGLLGLASMTADEVGLDPREGNFGQARFGETSYDLTGGEASKMRFIVNLVQSVPATVKMMTKGGTIRYEDTPPGIIGHFLRSQLSPAASLPVDAAVGKDYAGREFTWTEGAIRRAAPLIAQDLWDGYSSGGVVGSVKALPAFLGISTRRLDPEKLQRQIDAAINRPVAVELTEVARRELDRYGVDLKELKADMVRPGFKVEGTDGETVSPLRRDDPSGLALVAPDDIAHDLSEEISAVVEDAANSSDFASFESDATRAKYLSQVVRYARARIYAGLRLKAREEQLKELDRLEAYGRRLEERGRELRRGPKTASIEAVSQ